MMQIPRIIHQTWKTQKIPAKFLGFVKSWKRHHPHWQYVLWTDRDCRRFIRSTYPDYLSLYDAYDENIKRVDAFRYFLLHHFGGLYVDLDFECLRPLDPLLDGKTGGFMGLEPERHARQLHNRQDLICNALMASVPGHRFWEHIFGYLVASRDKKDVLDATGPRMLNEAYKTYPFRDMTLMPSTFFYPMVDWTKDDLPLEEEERRHYSDMHRYKRFPEESYAVHHWAGTWYSRDVPNLLQRFFVKLKSRIIYHSAV